MGLELVTWDSVSCVPHRATIILAQIAVPQSTFISVDKFILMTS